MSIVQAAMHSGTVDIPSIAARPMVELAQQHRWKFGVTRIHRNHVRLLRISPAGALIAAAFTSTKSVFLSAR